jgi:photosystem II stability/assembly factor-like uncharacterized protein
MKIINPIHIRLCATVNLALRGAIVTPGVIAVSMLLVFAGSATSQNWTPTGAPTNDWQSITTSADGAKLWASAHDVGPIYSSTNSGTNWSATGAPTGLWYALASSADGKKLLAAGSDYQYFTNGSTVYILGTTAWIYTSTNSGASWTRASNMPIDVSWTSAASSADGSKLAVAATSGAIYTSANSGSTWTLRSTPNKQWNSIASSADGTRLVAVAVRGGIYTSANSGVTWTPTGAPSDLWWWAVASSADGRRLVAGAFYNAQATAGGPLYISTNSGANWSLASVPRNNWASIASSADASTLVAAAAGVMAISKDSGATWTTNNPLSANSAWLCAAASADGNKLFAGASLGGIYESQTTAAPLLSFTSAGSALAIAWIIPSMELRLQESLDLSAINWMDVSTQPTVTNYQKQVILTPQSGNHFYRLKSY